MKVDDSLSTPGQRLRRARLLAGLNTRREFEDIYGISANTLQGWEQNKNPLSEKGARRVVEAFKKQGLLCSTEWLIRGMGMPPRPFDMLNAGLSDDACRDEDISILNLREEEAIYQEAQQFKQQNHNTIVLNVVDDALEPYYSVGDYIGGIQVPNEQIDDYIGHACIVELENNLILPRYLQKGTKPDMYNLYCTNPNAKSAPLSFYNIKVISAAPIVWRRRKLASLRNTI